MVGEHIDVTCGEDSQDETNGEQKNSEKTNSEKPSENQADDAARPFLGVRFACCDVYARIYTNRDSTAYVGNCPRCQRLLTIGIGPGGSDSRFFTAF